MNALPAQPKHRTVGAWEYHHIGGDGLPKMHTSELVVEALAPMTGFPYRFDTNEVRGVNVTEGGTAGEVYETDGGLYAVNIRLSEPLKPGERARVAYDTEFSYSSPPPPEFRRAVGAAGLRRLVMQVTFQSEKLPERVEWAQWDGYGPDAQIIPGTEESAHLVPISDDPGAPMEVFREFVHIPQGVYGFKWEW